MSDDPVHTIILRLFGRDRVTTTIATWCQVNGYSRSHYFVQRRLGRGPREQRCGRKVLITIEAALAYYRQQQP